MADGAWFAPAGAWAALWTGAALVAGLIVAIGAQNTFVLRQGLRREHVGTVVLFCAAADALLMAAGVAGLATLLGRQPALERWLTWGGALFIAGYGLRALARAWRPGAMAAGSSGPALPWRQAVAQTAAFTFLNPHVYLDTVLLAGSVGAQQGAARGWFLVGAAAASLAWFSALGFGARLLAPWFARPVAWRWLDAGVGVVMLALAATLVARSWPAG